MDLTHGIEHLTEVLMTNTKTKEKIYYIHITRVQNTIYKELNVFLSRGALD